MRIQNGIDVASRERVLTDDPTEQKEFSLEVFRTPVGKNFIDQFEATDANLEVVLKATKTIYPGAAHITVGMYTSGMEVAMHRAPSLDKCKPGLLKRKPAQPVAPAAEAPVEVPTDKNGRPLSQSQLDWSAMTHWSNEHSAEQCRQRARSDPKFAQFMHTNLVREMNSRPVDAAPSAGVQSERSATTADIQSELGVFASLYKNAPAERIRRPIAGRYVLDATHTYSVQEFETNLAQAARVGLL